MNNLLNFLKGTLCRAVLAFAVLMSSATFECANAQINENVPGQTADLIALVTAINNSVQKILNYYLPPPSAANQTPSKTPDVDTTRNNAGAAVALSTISNNAVAASNLATLQGMLTANTKTNVSNNIVSIATDNGLSTPYIVSPTTKPVQPSAKDNALSFDNFFTPTQYSTSALIQGSQFSSQQPSTTAPNSTQNKAAGLFVQMITAQGSPLTLWDQQTVNNLGTPQQQKYVNQYRQYVATMSIALSNLSQMYQARQKPQNFDYSQKQIEYNMATRRLNVNSKWFDKMETASPAVIQREQLYLLAEMNYQMYMMRQSQERLLATQSANLIMGVNTFLGGLLDTPPNSATQGQ